MTPPRLLLDFFNAEFAENNIISAANATCDNSIVIMKSSKLKIFAFFVGGVFFAGVLYSGIYTYLRNDDWIDHDAKWKFVNYSTGYVYDGHEVELKEAVSRMF